MAETSLLSKSIYIAHFYVCLAVLSENRYQLEIPVTEHTINSVVLLFLIWLCPLTELTNISLQTINKLS